MEIKWLMIGFACLVAAMSIPASMSEYSKSQCRVEVAKVPTRTAEDIAKICK